MNGPRALAELDLDTAASLLLRQQMALVDEGIGPRGTEPADPAVIAWAVERAGAEFDEHDLWDFGLISEEVHGPRCQRGYPHEVTGRGADAPR